MDFSTIFLLVLLFVISVIPTTQEDEEFQRSFNKLTDCEDGHTWVEKPVEELGSSYLVCEKCKIIPGTENKEES